MLMKIESRQKNYIRAAVELLAVGVAAMVVPASSALAQAQSPPVFNDKFQDPKSILNYCSIALINYKGPDEKSVEYKNCQDRTREAFNRWKIGQQPASPGPEAAGSGVCNLTEARKPLIDEEYELPLFARLHAAHGELKKALEPMPNNPSQDDKVLRLFGLPAHKEVRKGMRAAARASIANYENELNFNLRNIAAAADVSCFDCAILERWQVLKGAANLIAYSHHLSKADSAPQFTVGLNPDDSRNRWVLAWTDSLPISVAGKKPTPISLKSQPTELAKPYSEPHPYIKKYVLNEVSDQWVNSLPVELMDKLQRQICYLDFDKRAEDSDAYNKAPAFFEIAKGMQQIINEAFAVGSFEDATKAERGVGYSPADKALLGKPRNMVSEVEAKAGSKNCGQQQDPADNYEVLAWNLMPALGTPFAKPRWCKRYYSEHSYWKSR